jgi:hypothetical protein
MDGTFNSELFDLLRDANVRYQPISRNERWRHQQRWRECYCAQVKARTDKWRCGRFDWNTFDLGFARCWLDTKALHAYFECSAEDFLIVPDGNEGYALRCSGAVLPDPSPIHAEFYVFPASLEWTVVFTHEGPVFSKREWLSPQ